MPQLHSEPISWLVEAPGKLSSIVIAVNAAQAMRLGGIVFGISADRVRAHVFHDAIELVDRDCFNRVA